MLRCRAALVLGLLLPATAGCYYPPRWALEQLTVGAFQWRLLPAEFQPK